MRKLGKFENLIPSLADPLTRYVYANYGKVSLFVNFVIGSKRFFMLTVHSFWEVEVVGPRVGRIVSSRKQVWTDWSPLSFVKDRPNH